jgi:CDP-diglyceride synthetase
MAGITKQTVFMLAIYVVLLIIMYSLVGINIQSGTEDKKIPWLLYGFSFIGAMGCFFAMKKFEGGFKHKVRIMAYGIFLFALVTAALVLSKPTETENFKIFTYCSIAIVFIINLIAGIYLIDSSIKIFPNVSMGKNIIVQKYREIKNTPAISPTAAFSTQSVETVSAPAYSELSPATPVASAPPA